MTQSSECVAESVAIDERRWSMFGRCRWTVPSGSGQARCSFAQISRLRKVAILHDHRGGGIACRAREAGEWRWSACAQDELALLPPPRSVLLKMMLWFPYPVIEGLEELPCMD